MVRQDAYERLKNAIVNQEYRPGEIVSISELARDLGISRTPIREALNALERDFLVQMVDMRGVLIRPLSVDEIVQLNQMREVIDGLAARLAANLIPDKVIDDFMNRFKALERAKDGPDSDLHSQLSDELHRAITAASGNFYVQSQWAHLNTAFMRVKDRSWDVWRRSSDQKEVSRRRLKEHLSILAALKARNPAKAEAAAREHVARAAIDMFKYMHAPYG